MCQGFLMTATIATQQQFKANVRILDGSIKEIQFRGLICDISQFILPLLSLSIYLLLCCTFIGMFTIYNNNIILCVCTNAIVSSHCSYTIYPTQNIIRLYM